MQLPLKNKSSCRAWFLRFISYFISLINTALFYDPLRSFTLPLIDYLFQLLKLIIIIFNYFLDAVHRWKCQHHLTIKLTFHLTLTGFFFSIQFNYCWKFKIAKVPERKNSLNRHFALINDIYRKKRSLLRHLMCARWSFKWTTTVVLQLKPLLMRIVMNSHASYWFHLISFLYNVTHACSGYNLSSSYKSTSVTSVSIYFQLILALFLDIWMYH